MGSARGRNRIDPWDESEQGRLRPAGETDRGVRRSAESSGHVEGRLATVGPPRRHALYPGRGEVAVGHERPIERHRELAAVRVAGHDEGITVADEAVQDA